MLRISTSEDEQAVAIRLEGRVAGPWVVGEKKLQLDLRGVTFADDSGKQALRKIYAESGAEIVAKTAWSDYLAEEIRSNQNSNLA
jgi:hypothetical protein